MLPRKQRIKIADFIKIKKFPVNKYFTHFNLLIKRDGSSEWKFAINVPYRLDKRTVKRHYSRRVIEHLILEESDNYKDGGKVLIKVKKIIDKENRGKMLDELKNILKNELTRQNST